MCTFVPVKQVYFCTSKASKDEHLGSDDMLHEDADDFDEVLFRHHPRHEVESALPDGEYLSRSSSQGLKLLVYEALSY